LSKKLTYDYVKSCIESQEYQLLSKEYVKCTKKLEIKCPKGHIFDMSWDNFRAGHRCPECAIEKNSKKQRNSYTEVKSYIEKNNYILLSKNYKSNNSKLKLQCPEGHIFEMTLHNFKAGQRCPKCNHKNISKRRKLSYDYVKEYIESFNYTLLSEEYKDNREKLKIMCPNGHQYEVPFGRFRSGNRCPHCCNSKSFSTYERELQSFVKLIYNGKIINNNKSTIINPLTGFYLELDVYLPEINKAIEFNGKY